MLNTNALETYKYKDLAQMAKHRGIVGWHAMRKAQLVSALSQLKNQSMDPPPKSSGSKALSNGTKSNGNQSTRSNNGKNGSSGNPLNGNRLKKLQAAQSARGMLQNLSTGTVKIAGKKHTPDQDRIALLVRDSYWLQAYWELTDQSVQRARAALGAKWHGAKPVLRVFKTNKSGTASSADQIYRTIEVHGGVNHWYIDVQDPPMSFRVEIGYLASDGHFHSLARSNVVTSPRPGSREMLDGHWADVLNDADRVYAMSGGYDKATQRTGELKQLFEERLRRPMGSPMTTRFGRGAQNVLESQPEMKLQVEAEMIVYGVTDSDAYLTMGGEPVRVSEDGSFQVRVALPDKRQVLPVVAGRSDGVEEQTIVLAVERNTKVLEPRQRDITS